MKYYKKKSLSSIFTSILSNRDLAKSYPGFCENSLSYLMFKLSMLKSCRLLVFQEVSFLFWIIRLSSCSLQCMSFILYLSIGNLRSYRYAKMTLPGKTKKKLRKIGKGSLTNFSIFDSFQLYKMHVLFKILSNESIFL